MTPLSWEHWMERYTARGHHVLAPAWPGLDAEDRLAGVETRRT